jgi:hypothetical protein
MLRLGSVRFHRQRLRNTQQRIYLYFDDVHYHKHSCCVGGSVCQWRHGADLDSRYAKIYLHERYADGIWLGGNDDD